MALSEEYVKTQEHILGKEARKALAAIDDYDLKVRTMLYSNLRACGSINGKYDASVIAQTIANILEARAWEDYVEVDGTRKSCESFPKWLEICGIDINLAEYCLKEKRPDVLASFYEERDGILRAPGDRITPRTATIVRDEKGRIVSAKSTALLSEEEALSRKKKSGSQRVSSIVRRMSRDKDDPRVAPVYQRFLEGELSPQAAARELGWKPPLIRSRAASLLKNAGGEPIQQLQKDSGLLQEDFCKIAFHHALQTLTPELLDQYKQELLDG